MNLKSLAPGGDSAGNERVTLAHLRSKVMPTQEKFDPVVYLGTVHWVRAEPCEHAEPVSEPVVGGRSGVQ